MTLLHTILSSRVAALRSAETLLWPAGTLLTPEDVLVAGTSLADLGRTVGTPALWSDGAPEAQVVPGAPGRRVVLVVQVEAVVPPLHRPSEAWVDAELEGCSALLPAVRLLGRAGSARTTRYRLRPDREDALPGLVRLPVDLRRHDLLAIPCLAPVALEDVAR